jgi:hypothetical protein
MRDQDAGDCRIIKQKLLDICRAAHKPETIVRIACRELESFYLGDLKAIEKGLGIQGLSKLQNKKKYREPDSLFGPAQELKLMTKNCYQKVSGSRAIGRYLDLKNNRSHSFNVMVKAIENAIAKD